MVKVIVIITIQLLLLAAYDCLNVRTNNIKLKYKADGDLLYQNIDNILDSSFKNKNLDKKSLIQLKAKQTNVVKSQEDLYEIVVETPRRDYFNKKFIENQADPISNQKETLLVENQEITGKMNDSVKSDNYQQDIVRRTIHDSDGKIKLEPKTILNYGNVQYL